VRAVTSQKELERLHQAGEGLLYNDFSGRGKGASQYNVLHTASCRWVVRSNINVRKLFFADLDSAVAWLRSERAEEGVGWKRCATCLADIGLPPAPPAAQHTPPDPHNPSWHVEPVSPGHPHVEAWSRRRLPFGSNGEMRALRNALRAALRELRAADGEILHATYISPIDELCDTENVLIYNLESTACFGANARDGGGSAKARSKLSQPHRPASVAPRITTGTRPDRRARRSVGALAHFTAELPSPETLELSRLWYALKNGEWRLDGEAESPRLFGLRLRWATPGRMRNATELIKPVIDAVVTSLQAHDHPVTLPEVSARVAAMLGQRPDEVSNLLTDQRQTLLGASRLLWPWRASVQWNPCDDRCVAAELLIARDARPSLAGEVFAVSPR
jgi:hypothetical protein